MKNKAIAIIPARGGSVSIPDKNIKEFASRPLIYWVAQAANESKVVKKVIIATDSTRIKNVVNNFKFKKVAVVGRSKKSALGNVPSETALIEIAKRCDFKDLIFIQATNPFIRCSDIDRAYNLYKKKRYDSVFSAVPQKRFIWKEGKKVTSPLNYDYRNRPMRQDFKKIFVENGALYITSKRNLLKYKNRLSGKIGIYPMPPYSYFELDEPQDWGLAETVFLKYKKGESLSNLKSRKDKLTYCVDIDGVICTNTEGAYEKAMPFPKIIKRINELYKKGHKITLYTGRGSITGIDWRKITIKQLKKWNVKYHNLVMGKPGADVYIDDKCINIKDWR